jgi:hypothetical protein
MASMRSEGCPWRRKVGGLIQKHSGDAKMSIFQSRIDNTERHMVPAYRLRGGV